MFIDRVKNAIEDGIILGIKYTIILMMLFIGFYILTADYLVVRQRSYNGQAAYEAILKLQQQQGNK